MQAVTLTKWGNSLGVRIPASIIKEAHLTPGDELNISLDKNGRLSLAPIKNPQAGWKAAFNAIADQDNDDLFLDSNNEFDQDEWTW
jgi:antitoxin component of MazEF toxin-antitoxin module